MTVEIRERSKAQAGESVHAQSTTDTRPDHSTIDWNTLTSHDE